MHEVNPNSNNDLRIQNAQITGFKAIVKPDLKKSFGDEINYFKSVGFEVGSLLIIVIRALICLHAL